MLPFVGGCYIGASSVPVTIPSSGGSNYRGGAFSSLSQSMSPTASPSDNLHLLAALQHKHEHAFDVSHPHCNAADTLAL